MIIKFQQNPTNHRLKNKTTPTFNKKTIIIILKINNKKSPLKGEKEFKI